jgi:hypothetical protein
MSDTPRSLTDELFSLFTNAIEERYNKEGIPVDGLGCVDAMVNVLTLLIDEAPNKHTKDTYALYASSLIVTTLQDKARARGEPDNLPEGVDAERIATARRIVQRLRGIAEAEEAMDNLSTGIPDDYTLH